MPGRRGRVRPYKFVDDIVTLGSKELSAQFSVPDEIAKEFMRQIAHQVCWMNAKQLIYIPEDLEFELTKRDLVIWAEYQKDGPGPHGARKFSGARVDELATEYSLSAQQIYNIVRLMKKREIAARQGVLPGLEGL